MVQLSAFNVSVTCVRARIWWCASFGADLFLISNNKIKKKKEKEKRNGLVYWFCSRLVLVSLSILFVFVVTAQVETSLAKEFELKRERLLYVCCVSFRKLWQEEFDIKVAGVLLLLLLLVCQAARMNEREKTHKWHRTLEALEVKWKQVVCV